MSLLTQEALFLPHRVWKVKFVGKRICNRIIRVSIANGERGVYVLVLYHAGHVKVYGDWWCSSTHSGGEWSADLGVFRLRKELLVLVVWGWLDATASLDAVQKETSLSLLGINLQFL
jgi:hypothetical protein